MDGCVLTTLITVTHYRAHVTDDIFKVTGSRSGSDGHRNVLNAIAPEVLKGFEPKLKKYFTH